MRMLLKNRETRPQHAVMPDEALMDLIREGDARAFEVVFDRHSGPAFSLAYRMCGRKAIAEDVVQEAFMSLWRTSSRYDSRRGSVRNWVLSAVHNRAIDAFRREIVKDNKNVSDDGIAERIESSERTDVEVERRDEATKVRAALSTLPTDQQQVIELAYFGGFTHTEIATMLELPAGTVKGRMRLGMTKLRAAMTDASLVVK